MKNLIPPRGRDRDGQVRPCVPYVSRDAGRDAPSPTTSVDWSVLPRDLAALYAGECEPEQLALPVETAEAEFKRWLEAQPEPDYLTGVAHSHSRVPTRSLTSREKKCAVAS